MAVLWKIIKPLVEDAYSTVYFFWLMMSEGYKMGHFYESKYIFDDAVLLFQTKNVCRFYKRSFGGTLKKTLPNN